MLPCHHKIRYASREFAQAHIAELQGSKGEHPVRGAWLQAYLCQAHGCWHVGHRRPGVAKRSAAAFIHLDAQKLIQGLRRGLILDHGRTKQPELWQGVRVLSRVLRHLNR